MNWWRTTPKGRRIRNTSRITTLCLGLMGKCGRSYSWPTGCISTRRVTNCWPSGCGRSWQRSADNVPTHPHDRQTQTACQCYLVAVDDGVAERCIKRLACQRRDDVHGAKAGLDNSLLTGGHNASANPPARPCGVNEKGPDTRGVQLRVEQFVRVLSATVSSVERTPPTPAAASDNHGAPLRDESG